MYAIELNDTEKRSIQTLITGLARQFRMVGDPDFLMESAVAAHELPRRLRQFLIHFKNEEVENGCALMSGLPVDDEKIGATPPHWKCVGPGNPALEYEIFLMLCAALLGDALAWSTQQSGRIVHDVLPIRGHEHEQLGTGSEQLLWWHTEDAFHPFRADYIGLLCLRNPDSVSTTVCAVDMIELDADETDRLFEPVFTIRPDESHRPKNGGNGADPAEVAVERQQEAYTEIERMNTRPDRISVLYGDKRSPYLRIDPYFMDPAQDVRAQSALESFIRRIDRALMNCTLKPGDTLFVDNYRAVHGRQPFRAHFNGRDRWLKRINVTRDLRRSRESRISANSRVIY